MPPTCQAIIDGKGDYLFVVKDKQPDLKAGIAESFGAPPLVPARALAAIRNLVPLLIRSSGMSAPETRENFREDRAEAIAPVIGRIL
jgi:hypothetical protein